MNHERIKELLFEYYDGECAPDNSAFIKSHLTTCTDCQTDLESWKKTAQVLFQSQLSMESTDYFVTRVMSRLPSLWPHDQRGFFGFFWKPLLVAASFLLVVWSYLASNGASSETIEAILLADARSSTVVTWMSEDRSIASDEFANYALGGE